MSDRKVKEPKKREFRFLPLSLCVETLGGVATKMILRGTPLPAKRSQVFSTASNDQEQVEIKAFMGESPIAKNNLAVGRFLLRGIPQAPRGQPQIPVTFEVDRQCNVRVYIAEKSSGGAIEADTSNTQPDLSDDVISRLLQQAEENRGADQELLGSIEARNRAEQLIDEAENYIIEQQNLGPQGVTTSKIERVLAALGLSIEDNNVIGITQNAEELQSLLQQSRTAQSAAFSDFYAAIFGAQAARAAANSPPADSLFPIFGAPSKRIPKPSPQTRRQTSPTTVGQRKVASQNDMSPQQKKPLQIEHTPILAVFANPRGSNPLRLSAEDRVIHECLRLSKYRGKISLDVLHAATIHDVRRALLEKDYRIVQFSGHGTGLGLALEDQLGQMRLVPQEALAEFLSAYSPPIECVILNACYSKLQGQLIAAKVPYVIEMDGAISDEGATEFTRGFYDAIGAGKDIEFAYQEGCRTIKLMGLPGGCIPAIHKR